MEKDIPAARLKFGQIFIILFAILYQYFSTNTMFGDYPATINYLAPTLGFVSIYLAVEIELGHIVSRRHFAFAGLDNGLIFLKRLKFTLLDRKLLVIFIIYYIGIFFNRHMALEMAFMVYQWSIFYAILTTMLLFTIHDCLEKFGISQYLLPLPFIAIALISYFGIGTLYFLFLPKLMAEFFLNENIIMISLFSCLYFVMISILVYIVQRYFIRFGFFK
jgi:hypothetical protein